MRTTPELAPTSPITPRPRKDISALIRFNVHRAPTRWVFSGTGLKLVSSQPRSDTLTTMLPWSRVEGEEKVQICTL
ncbi:hypothetical protein TNCV_24311 [Trichonephila clavipes]|nr:hypothetical protein TNCV_24311 [Trichonephila clavipes]